MMDGRDLHIPNERPGKSGFGLGLKNTYKGLKLDLTTDPSGWGSRLKNTYKGLKQIRVWAERPTGFFGD
jgi:hypothetical protein